MPHYSISKESENWAFFAKNTKAITITLDLLIESLGLWIYANSVGWELCYNIIQQDSCLVSVAVSVGTQYVLI